MPLFGSKFSPKKGTPRKSPSLSNLNLDATERQSEFGLDQGPIKIRLGSNEIVFDDGQWVSGKRLQLKLNDFIMTLYVQGQHNNTGEQRRILLFITLCRVEIRCCFSRQMLVEVVPVSEKSLSSGNTTTD